jgi:hypothetical protein
VCSEAFGDYQRPNSKEPMMVSIRTMVLAAAFALCGCTAPFVSTWKAPDAKPFELRGAKVAAVVMMRNEAARRSAEDTLANEISAHGAQGVPMYQIFPDAKPSSETQAKAALEKAGFAGVVVLRPVSVDKEVVSTPVTYSGAPYGGYWGGYYGYGWGSPWGPTVTGGEIRTNTIVTIETLIYSFRQNKLVWGGQSRTTNPRDVDKVVSKLSADVAKELQKEGLIGS